MNSRTVSLLLLAWLGFAAAPVPAAEPLGRLFLTPEQRAALDARRKARIPDKPVAAAVESPTTRVDGLVRRSDGKSTLWLNGEAIPEGTQPEGLRVLPRGGDPSRVSIGVGEAERRFDLKVGQTLDRGDGAVRDVIGGGEVRVKRQPPPRAR